MKLNFLRLFDKPLKRFYFQKSFFNILALFLAIYRSLFLGFFLAKMKKWYENSIGCIFSAYFFPWKRFLYGSRYSMDKGKFVEDSL